jgi:hypothetical protein
MQSDYHHQFKDGKMIPHATIPGMRGGLKKSGGVAEFKYDIFHTLQELL